MSGSCDANIRWLHLRLRLAGFRMRGLRKASLPAHTIKTPECFEIGAREDFGRYMKRLDERLRSPDTHGAAPVAETMGGVVAFGLNQLDPASRSETVPDVTTSDQGENGFVSERFAAPPHSDANFVICWAEAMGREMGAEELEKFSLSLRDPHHGTTT